MNCQRGMRLGCRVRPVDQGWALLLQFSLEVAQRRFASVAAEFGLAPAQALALHELDEERPIPMRELAGRLSCDPSNITGLTDRLEDRGLLRRETGLDRRVKALVLTAEGKALRKALATRLYEAPACLGRLVPEDQAKLAELLGRVLAAS
ncbi:MAG: MarR family winged helix-turn-helix transcriptional regulator [Chloroflexota bacterium]